MFQVETVEGSRDALQAIIDALHKVNLKIVVLEWAEAKRAPEAYDKVIASRGSSRMEILTSTVNLETILHMLTPRYKIVLSIGQDGRAEFKLSIGRERITAYSKRGRELEVSSEESVRVARWILEKAVEDVLRRLPGLNCGHCGYTTCRELAERIIQGDHDLGRCPVGLDVDLRVNGKPITLTPYPKLVAYELLKAFASTLKGVPADLREVTLRIKLND